MKWLLIAMLVTPQGNIQYSARFEFQYQCLSELQTLQARFPGSSGSCSYGG